ncbi:hypothetical protein PENSPDRAFT_656485 [Peniophora sp. CONT]|nr:hypothetical protein PENSPDRAFT_656485 [Peniophora sp. CONT]
MSEDPIGICCLVAITACAEVCAAACIDFTTVRQSFTACFWPKRCRSEEDEDYTDDEEHGAAERGEREPLIRSEPLPSTVQPQETADMEVSK